MLATTAAWRSLRWSSGYWHIKSASRSRLLGKMAPAAKETAAKKRPRSSSSPSNSSSPANTPKKTKNEEQSLAPTCTARLSKEHPEWPAKLESLAAARDFLQRAALAAKGGERNDTILLVPDKDADGLSAGLVVKRTLLHMGARDGNIRTHHIRGGQSPTAREDLEGYGARWIIVLDQGSGKAPPLVKGAEQGWQDKAESSRESRVKQEPDTGPHVRTMVIDHHHVTDLYNDCPEGALLVNACQHLPVSTSALLAWCICRPLWPAGEGQAGAIDYLALIGTCGDLSINVSWDPPWPDFAPELKRWGKSRIGKVIAMVNAPRRTPQHDAATAWEALDASENPLDVLSSTANPSYDRLQEARRLVAAETERCTHTPPKFAKDGRIALLTIHTGFQVHPSIATRWSGTLKGAKKLEAVMCANTGFGAEVERDEKKQAPKVESDGAASDGASVPGRYVHFSCRIANAAKQRGEDTNIIALLHDYAARDPTFLSDLHAAGQGHFARGHREASGGILPPHFWQRFVSLMEIGVKPSPPPDGAPKTSLRKNAIPAQNNKLTNYFSKPPAA